MRQLYPNSMIIDSGNECLCRADDYKGGLLIVRVIDEETHVIEEILSRIHKDITISFIASTKDLFRY